MYKLAIKFLIVTLVLTGASLVFSSSGKVLAASCPSGDSVPADWGNDSDGEGAGVMSSLVMRARDESGNPLNPHFTLQSQAKNWPDNAQIFHWPIGSGGSVSNTDQWPQHGDFQFGTHLSGDGGANCNGWVVLGPGIDGNVGNGWVLNCKNPSGNNNYFWVSHVDNPAGQSGTWELLDANGVSIDTNINSGSSPHIHFPVVNGANMRLTLVWHPAPQPLPTYGTCQRLDVGISGNYNGHNKRAHVVVNQVTNGQVKINGGGWQGGTGGNIDENIPSDSGGTGSYDKVYAYQPQANSITVTVTVEYHDSTGWHLVPGANNPNNIRTTSQPCFTAQCSIQYVEGTGPNGIVLAGQQMHIHGTYTNTSPGPDNLPIWNPSLDVGGSNNSGNNGVHVLWGSPPPAYTGFPYDFDMYLTAPNNVATENLTFTPVYFNSQSIGSPCYGAGAFGGGPGFVYQSFNASVSASSTLKPTIEHPYQGDTYLTSITVKNDSSHAVNIPTNSSFYKLISGGAKQTYASNGGGTYGSSPGGNTTNTLSGHLDLPNGSYQAGDEYCAAIHANYTSGYVGPDNNVIFGSGPQDAVNCPRVTNEPYFKVYNGDIWSGGAFDKCTTDGGTLAGYADISDPANATRGSSTQLSALALLKITGVASAKTSADINGSPTKLSFANTGVQVDSTGNESPVLGGQFGGCRQLTNETMPASAANYASATFGIAGKSGAYQHSGNLTLSGGTLAANQNVSMFVNGDVYISGNVTYGNNWQAGTAPSFVLHATGNIYISRSVTNLAGLYIAQDKSDGTKGKIYTCADTFRHFSPMAAASIYNGCRNQLVVMGNFVAKQVNLMRTFGSLRDEEPKPGSPGGSPAVDLTWSSCGKPGKGLPGEACPDNTQLASLRCTAVNEPSDSHGWYDNKICVPNSSSVNLYWTHCQDYSGCDQSQASIAADPGLLHLDNIKKGIGTPNGRKYPYCTPWNAPDPDTWSDNWLCSDQNVGLNFSSVGGTGCTKVNELADPDANWSSGYYVCVNTSGATGPSPSGPPFTCSNPGSQPESISCAGEIFEYSPTLYLSNPVVNPPGGGSVQFQSITSLPPVL